MENTGKKFTNITENLRDLINVSCLLFVKKFN